MPFLKNFELGQKVLNFLQSFELGQKLGYWPMILAADILASQSRAL